MAKFLDPDFLLNNKTAMSLYHDVAKGLPIVDYHCHLSAKQIYENYQFKSITEIWLGGDHYKWRAMRANGIDESLVTGSASDYEKFLAWAKTVPMTLGNPLYLWSHLELQRYFGVDTLINERTAPEIWERTNNLLQSEGFRARDLIKKFNVESICTTDDPTDGLEYHVRLKEDRSFGVAVIPTFRPDKALKIGTDTFVPWLEKLGDVAGNTIGQYSDLLNALESRAQFFHEAGCRVSDHDVNTVSFALATIDEVSEIFDKATRREELTPLEESKYQTFTLQFLGRLYARLGWVMQLHMHASRNNNHRMFRQLGPDAGYDSMQDGSLSQPLCQLLNVLEEDNSLPKTILYSLNPKDYMTLAALMGSFQGGGIPGKLQLGAAWWFNDTKDGMLNQMKTLANVGLLSRFVGMTTDSRSFLSYPRHEYFRRLLCNMLGEWVESGEAPDDMELLGDVVRRISYGNAKEYFMIR